MLNVSKFFKKRWKWIVALLVLASIGGGWFWNQKQGTEENLITQTPREGELVKTISISGKIDAEERVRLRYQLGGKIVYLGASEGQMVKKGQVLATIDQALLQKQLKQDLNNYMKERWDWEQLRDDVVENGYGEAEPVPNLETRRQVDNAQRDLENSVLSVEIRSISIRDTKLIAPFDGILTYMPVSSTGVQIGATEYFELVNPQTLVFKAEVDEQDIGQIRIGQLADVSLDALPDDTINTNVSYIPFTSTATSNGTVFIIELPLAQAYQTYPLRLGMSGDVDIVVDRKDSTLSIPIEAIRQRDDRYYVDILEGDKKKEREVVTGLETENEIEIISGLTDKDQVVIPQ